MRNNTTSKAGTAVAYAAATAAAAIAAAWIAAYTLAWVAETLHQVFVTQ